MANFATQFAAVEQTDLMSSLGINWQLLIFQIIAFGILVFALGKWVFPVFFRIIDKRQAVIEESNRAAIDASKYAEKAQAEIAAMLKQARSEAKDIVSTAKEEAGAMVQDAETRGKTQAEHIVSAAHEEITKEVIAAKKALHNETVDLVAMATEKVVGSSVDAKVDGKVIEAALKEAK